MDDTVDPELVGNPACGVREGGIHSTLLHGFASDNHHAQDELSCPFMIDPNMELLSTVVVSAVERLAANPGDASVWEEVRATRDLTADDDPDLAAAIEAQDVASLQSLVEEWNSGQRLLPACDRAVLKRAMKAFRKSLKVTRLDAESKLGGGPLSSGTDSLVVGIQPPRRYPLAVWMELVRQGRLATDGRGTFELPSGS